MKDQVPVVVTQTSPTKSEQSDPQSTRPSDVVRQASASVLSPVMQPTFGAMSLQKNTTAISSFLPPEVATAKAQTGAAADDWEAMFDDPVPQQQQSMTLKLPGVAAQGMQVKQVSNLADDFAPFAMTDSPPVLQAANDDAAKKREAHRAKVEALKQQRKMNKMTGDSNTESLI